MLVCYNANTMQPNENQNQLSDPNQSTIPNNIQPPATNPTTPTPPTNFYKKAFITLIVVLVILVVGGGAFALYHHYHKAKPVAYSSLSTSSKTTKPLASTTTAMSNNGIITYVSDDNTNLIVTNDNQKVLAKITNPSGDKGFNVLSNNGQDVLIVALTSSGTNEPEYLVNYKGTVTNLPTTVSSPNVTGTSEGPQLLGYNNDYIENSCTNDSLGNTLTCYIDNVNLTTGAVNVVTSFSNSTANPSENPPSAILGVSPNNTLYVLYDSSSNTTGANPVIKEINLSSKQITNTVNVPGGATNGAWMYYALSNNFDYYANVGARANQIQITNLNTGTTSTVNTQCSSGVDSTTSNLFWSPDNSKIAYDCYGTDGSFVAYDNLTSNNVTQLKNISTSNLGENFNVEGWSSNNIVNFYYTSSYNATPNSWDFYSADTTSGAINLNPTPTGYWLVSGQGL